MILMSTYVLGEIPFETVYLHGMVRDEKGEKMSKSKGNAIDPLDMVAKYGADATRLSLLIGNTPGNDLKLSEEKIAGFRNFTNKLWNICRFMLLNIPEPKIGMQEPEAKTLYDKDILLTLDEKISVVTDDLKNLRFSLAGENLREFTWGYLADWYLEIAKIESDKSEILNYILNTILKLWHPFMPFVTEAIWREIYGADQFLMIESWPQRKINITSNERPSGIFRNSISPISFAETKRKIHDEVNLIYRIITGIRSLRADNKIEPSKKLDAVIIAGKKINLIKENLEIIKGLARLEKVDVQEKGKKPDGAAGFVESGVEVYINLAGTVDVVKEKSRLQSEIASIEPYLAGLEKKLANQEFVKNAPAAVVEKEKQKLSEAQEKLKKLKEQYENLH